MNGGTYYPIDVWGLLAAMLMVVAAAAVSWRMRLGIGRTLLLVGLPARCCSCARMGLIIGFVIRADNPWLVALLESWSLLGVAGVQITLSRAKGVPRGMVRPVLLALVITMLLMLTLCGRADTCVPTPLVLPAAVVPLTGMLLGNSVSALAVGVERGSSKACGSGVTRSR